MRKLGFYINGDYRGLSYEEAFRELASMGYMAVEIPYRKGEMAKLRMAAEQAGLTLSEAVVQRDYVTRDPAEGEKNIADTITALKECSDAGIGIINVFSGPIPWGKAPLQLGQELSVKEAWQRVFTAFDRMAPVAQQTGVLLGVESVWGMLAHDFFTGQYLVSRYPENAVCVNYDPSHDVISGNTDLRFVINGWGKRIRHIHLKDAVGIMQPGRFVFPMLGEGVADWAGFRAGLDDIGYDGVMSVEFESPCLDVYYKGDLSLAARSSMQAIRTLGLDK